MKYQLPITKKFSFSFSLSFFLLTFASAGGIAQLARALAWHARGHGFKPHYLHKKVLVRHSEGVGTEASSFAFIPYSHHP